MYYRAREKALDAKIRQRLSRCSGLEHESEFLILWLFLPRLRCFVKNDTDLLSAVLTLGDGCTLLEARQVFMQVPDERRLFLLVLSIIDLIERNGLTLSSEQEKT